MSEILGVRDIFYGQYLLQFSKYVASVTHHRSIGAATEKFGTIYPLASFIVFYLAQISGNIFYSLCMNESLLYTVGDVKTLLVYLVFWSLTFHCPKDLFYSVFGKSSVGSVLSVVREVERVISAQQITDAVLAKSGSSAYSAFMVTLITINLPYHLIYLFDQMLRGVATKKHELLSPSFTTRLTVFDSFIYNWYLYLGQISGKYAIVDIVSNIPKVKFVQLIASMAVTMKTLAVFNHDFLVMDELLLIAPLMKIGSLLPCCRKEDSTAAGKTRRSASIRHNESEMTVEGDVTIVNDSDDESTTIETPKKRGPRGKRTASVTRRRKQ